MPYKGSSGGSGMPYSGTGGVGMPYSGTGGVGMPYSGAGNTGSGVGTVMLPSGGGGPYFIIAGGGGGPYFITMCSVFEPVPVLFSTDNSPLENASEGFLKLPVLEDTDMVPLCPVTGTLANKGEVLLRTSRSSINNFLIFFFFHHIWYPLWLT